jgi:hypothetical protein
MQNIGLFAPIGRSACGIDGVFLWASVGGTDMAWTCWRSDPSLEKGVPFGRGVRSRMATALAGGAEAVAPVFLPLLKRLAAA